MRNTESRRLFGRRVIYTEVTDINEGNIIDVLQKALFTHLQNQAEIHYLYWYYKGEQPILHRVRLLTVFLSLREDTVPTVYLYAEAEQIALPRVQIWQDTVRV